MGKPHRDRLSDEERVARRRATQAKYRAANKKKIAAATAKWRDASSDIYVRLRKLQRGLCAVCRVKLTAAGEHLDHIMPLALGGPHADANLQLLCPPCNLAKNAKHPVEFMQRRGFLL